MNSVRLNKQSFTASGLKNIGIRKLKFVAKTQFLWKKLNYIFHYPNQLICIKTGGKLKMQKRNKLIESREEKLDTIADSIIYISRKVCLRKKIR